MLKQEDRINEIKTHIMNKQKPSFNKSSKQTSSEFESSISTQSTDSMN